MHPNKRKITAFIKFALKLALSGALVYLVIKISGVNSLYLIFSEANPLYLLASLLVLPFYIYFKSLKWGIAIKIFGEEAKIGDLVKCTLISFAFGIITPGRVGELIKVKHITENSHLGYAKSISSVILEKIFDMASAVFLILLGLVLFWDKAPMIYAVPALILYSAAFLLAPRYLYRVFDFFLKKKGKGFANIPDKFPLMQKNYFSLVWLSIAGWISLSVQAFLILKALSIENAPFYATILLVPLMAISSILPISLGGIGVREVVSLHFFSYFGISPGKSVAFSLMYTFATLAVSAFAGAMLYIKKQHKANRWQPERK